MADQPLVLYEPDGRIAYLTLNRPESLNAMNPDLLADFDRALEAFRDDPDRRVAILRGAGRSFSAGYDQSPGRVALSHARNAIDDRARLQGNMERWLRIWDCPKPVIAQVHGNCFGGGNHIPLFCDLVTIADDAVIGWPQIPLGAGLGTPTWTLVVGSRRAKEMSLIVGRKLSGREAFDWGYANMHFAAPELAEKTRELAMNVAKQPLDMLRINKLATNRVLEMQGFRAAVLSGVEWDSIAHEAPCVKESQRWITELGLRGAIAKYAAEGM